MSERYRVLQVIARLNVGGPANQACALTSRLDPTTYDTRLVAGTVGPQEADLLSLMNVTLAGLTRVPELGREPTATGDMVALAKLVHLMRRERPHIVHTHTAKAGALGRLAAWLTGVPVIVHNFHGHVLRGYFGPTKERTYVAIERALARVTTHLVAVSETVRSELLGFRIGRPDRFSVIKVGLDLEPFLDADRLRDELRQELGLATSVPLIGIVGRLVPIKRHTLFLDTAARLARVTPAHFVIVGDGELRATLEFKVAQLGLGGRVHFLGWRADLPRIYAGLDIVTLTSINEGSPVVLIEAMAAGRPVVATRAGGVVDVVAHGVTGLVAEHSAEALSQAVSDLMRDEGRRAAMGRRGRVAVYPAYSVPRLLSDMDALYRDALAGSAV